VHWITHATFWSQVGLGIIGIAALCIYNGQLTEMRKSTDAATNSAYTACVAAQIARGALIEAQRSGTDAHQATRAATAQALAATQAQAAAIHVDLPPEPTFDRDIEVKGINFTNTGNTDAKTFNAKVRALFSPRTTDPEFSFPKGNFSNIRAVALTAKTNAISTGQRASISVRNDDGTVYQVKDGDLADYRMGEKDILVFERITWADIFGVPHWMNVCKVYQVFPERFVKTNGHERCSDEYNGEDNNGAIGSLASKVTPIEAITEITCVAPKDTRQPVTPKP
jgi:hypothetical protein